MPGIALSPGEAGLLLESASHDAGTVYTDDYWLVKSGGGIITLDITTIGTGQIDSVTVQKKTGSNYDDIFTFAALGLLANGRYPFRILPASDDATAWPYGISDIMPPFGRVKIISSVGAVVYQVTLEALEF